MVLMLLAGAQHTVDVIRLASTPCNWSGPLSYTSEKDLSELLGRKPSGFNCALTLIGALDPPLQVAKKTSAQH